MAKKASRPNQEGIFNNSLHSLGRMWREIARLSGRNGSNKDSRPNALQTQIEACLAEQGGEVSARARAAQLAQSYLDFSAKERLVFLQILARNFGVENAKVNEAFNLLKHA